MSIKTKLLSAFISVTPSSADLGNINSKTNTNNLYITLENLFRIQDDTIVYVSSSSDCISNDNNPRVKDENQSNKNEKSMNTENTFMTAEGDYEEEDPLDVVKQFYEARARGKQFNKRTNHFNSNRKKSGISKPLVQPSLVALPSKVVGGDDVAAVSSLISTSSSLPSATCRQEIINVIESNRVTIISGSTGSGKSTFRNISFKVACKNNNNKMMQVVMPTQIGM